MTDYPHISPTKNHKVWYGLRNLCIGDDEQTRIYDELTQWPEEARVTAQEFLNQNPPNYEAAYRAVLKWSIRNEMGSLNAWQLRSLITFYLISNIREELMEAPSMFWLYRELEQEV